MILTYKNLNSIEYPVFILPSSNWDSADGLLYLDGVILDDKNMPGETLGVRRIQSPFQDLVPLKKGIFSPIGILKQTSYTPLIDNLGRCFMYEKTITAPLITHKIRKVEKKGTHSLVWVKDYNFPFQVPRPPPNGITWASVLHICGTPWLLYSYSEFKNKRTFRKI
jgi:hypothetical protein